ncbi:hypothetical protein [Rhodohalobacter sp. 614A]|uniref:hypothetical protein n=1 Tax=Rhodohalobacter sp. 614A TaxID=2908649 RepID=UPI001F35B58A|nr:hypothetical protein [Rhodohalobacter sp. 614A]
MYPRLIFLLIITLSLGVNAAFAQFEGEIRFRVFNPDQKSEETVNMEMTFTKNRIFIDSNTSTNVMAGLQAKGVLVRHDLQDFVVITDQQEALKVAKSDLESLINLLNRMKGREESTASQPFPWEERLVQTGEQKEILGYNAHQFILKGNAEGEYASVWLTEDIVVDWGLLSDAWYAIGSKQIDQEVPIEIVMNNQSFPLLIEAFEKDELVFKAESVSVDENTFDRSKTRLSSDLKVIGLTDLMMNMFMQQN